MSQRPTSQLRHDLRTPLTHLIGYAEMLLEEVDLPELRTVLEQSQIIVPLVNDFLASPQADAEAPDLSPLQQALDKHLRSVSAAAETARSRLLRPDLLADLERIPAAVAQLDVLLGGGAAPGARDAPSP